ncbi:hypothetical protein ASPWEDRAFT_39739 [Aspergillus wentii DTO 134E9]|uniref:Ig-like domain-containing protein n=1 Tax=Aspergillus wentii DTO 134E9 TaxID=1073089 RepID=A0A1L9RIA2_ASPWE|nr:uncharacterized protein ASPWEDRAFT_39739 [Aspergillus wentii DTO 134E9]OJJ34662.1 hypothetical protein ASPWEDRAFT_39739 [Aspergillus wentii DTO 134E9]
MFSTMYCISAFTLLLANLASSEPIPRSQVAHITFIGAADAQFTQDFPADGSKVAITDRLSISHIASSTAGVTCTFNGIDHSVTTVNGAATVDVGPPQTQIQGSCLLQNTPPPSTPPPSSTPPRVVQITFEGAANAQFTQWFPVDGSQNKISDPLSISHIVSTTGGVICTFNGIDHSVTTVNGAQTVDVGPPQTQINGACKAQ